MVSSTKSAGHSTRAGWCHLRNGPGTVPVAVAGAAELQAGRGWVVGLLASGHGRLYLTASSLPSALRGAWGPTGEPDHIQPLSEDPHARKPAIYRDSREEAFHRTEPENDLV